MLIFRTTLWDAYPCPQYVWVLRRLSNKTHMHPPLRQQISDLVTSLQSIPNLSANLTSSSITDLKAFIRISRVLFRPFSWRAELLNADTVGRQYDQRRKLQEALDQEEWYATAKDVRKIWTNVVRHRIGVRVSEPRNFRVTTRGVYIGCNAEQLQLTKNTNCDPLDAMSKATADSHTKIVTEAEDDMIAGILLDIMQRCTA
jgi:hypothetical protein